MTRLIILVTIISVCLACDEETTQRTSSDNNSGSVQENCACENKEWNSMQRMYYDSLKGLYKEPLNYNLKAVEEFNDSDLMCFIQSNCCRGLIKFLSFKVLYSRNSEFASRSISFMIMDSSRVQLKEQRSFNISYPVLEACKFSILGEPLPNHYRELLDSLDSDINISYRLFGK